MYFIVSCAQGLSGYLSRVPVFWLIFFRRSDVPGGEGLPGRRIWTDAGDTID